MKLGKAWGQAQECTVELEDGQEARALAYCPLVGIPTVGDTVLLTAAAAARGLGTGGYLMIAAIPDRLPTDPEPGPGHIVKARYTPLQYMTMGADEQESPWHELLAEADSIDGMPVVVADLHSALPAVVAAIRARRPEARIAYIMDDGGALPVWFSRTCSELTEREGCRLLLVERDRAVELQAALADHGVRSFVVPQLRGYVGIAQLSDDCAWSGRQPAMPG